MATDEALKQGIKGAAIGSAASIALVPGIVSALGFGSGGIIAGSTAAGMMSAAAVAGGGGVAAGSTVAVMQTIGAAGLFAAGGPVVISVAAVGGVVGAMWGGVHYFRTRPQANGNQPNARDAISPAPSSNLACAVSSSPMSSPSSVTTSLETATNTSSSTVATITTPVIVRVPSYNELVERKHDNDKDSLIPQTLASSPSSPISCFLPSAVPVQNNATRSVETRNAKGAENAVSDSSCELQISSNHTQDGVCVDCNSLECAMCLEMYDGQEHCPMVLATCGHSLCSKCVAGWAKSSLVQCPTCSKTTSTAKLVKNYALLAVLKRSSL